MKVFRLYPGKDRFSGSIKKSFSFRVMHNIQLFYRELNSHLFTFKTKVTVEISFRINLIDHSSLSARLLLLSNQNFSCAVFLGSKRHLKGFGFAI